MLHWVSFLWQSWYFYAKHNFLAALAVYVRRAYRAYTVLTIDYEEGDGLDDGDAPHVVTWRFRIGQSNSPPSTPRIDDRK